MAELAGKRPRPSRTSTDRHSYRGSDWSKFGILTVEECEAFVVAARRLAAADARSNRHFRPLALLVKPCV